MAEKTKVVSKKMTEEDADRLVAVLKAAEVEGIEKIKEAGGKHSQSNSLIRTERYSRAAGRLRSCCAGF